MDTVTEQQLDEYINSVCRTDAIRKPLRRHLLALADKLIKDAKEKAAKTRSRLLQLADKLIADACDKAGEARRHGFEFSVPTLDEAIREVIKAHGNQFDPPNIPTYDEAILETIRDFGKSIKSEYTLKQLVKITNHFLGFIDWLGRPLLPTESKPWRVLLLEWEAASIKAEALGLSEEDKNYYLELLAQLREVFKPDPIRQIRLQRVRSEHVAKHHEGNYATISQLFEGVFIRRSSVCEVVERAQFLGRQCNNITVLVRELAIIRDKDKEETEKIVKLSKKLIKVAKSFNGQCQHAPTVSFVDDLQDLIAQTRKFVRNIDYLEDKKKDRQIAGLSRKLVKCTRAFGQRVEQDPAVPIEPGLAECMSEQRTLNGLMEAIAG